MAVTQPLAAEPDFDSFGYDDAFRLGTAMTAHAAAEHLPVAIRIMFGAQVVFHSALPGSSADNDAWLHLKINMVTRFGVASMLTKQRVEDYGLDMTALVHLDPREYALAGGGVPIRVRGSLVGVVAVSGLTDQDDHDLVVRSLTEHIRGVTP